MKDRGEVFILASAWIEKINIWLIWISLVLAMSLITGCRQEEPPNQRGGSEEAPSEALVEVTATAEVPSITPTQAEEIVLTEDIQESNQIDSGTTNLPLTQNGDTNSPSEGQEQEPSPTTAAVGAGPEDGAQATTPQPVKPTSTPLSYPIHEGAPLDRSDIGIQIHLHREDLDWLMAHLTDLNVGWVKVQVSWKIYQPEPDRLDDYRFDELDRLIAAANDAGIQVLLGVAKAPEWSRPTTELDGPPSDYEYFSSFMRILASRYQGQVAAYELWNEPNLRREWNGYPLSAADLVRLIAAGASGVKAADPQALIISAAPAVTGINDGLNAVDDRIYFQQMLDAGVLQVVDAMSAHPYGWANPPDSTYQNPDPAVPSHNNHPSFFFLDTLNDYRLMLNQSGYGDVPIWITEFGWGSFDRLGANPPDEVAFMANVNEQQQAEYIVRGFELAGEMDGVGPQFLWNLNFAPRLGAEYAVSGYSILRTDGEPRPAYFAMKSLAGSS
jgi:hypothetical protein